MGMVCELRSEVDPPVEASTESRIQLHRSVTKNRTLLPIRAGTSEAGIDAASERSVFAGGFPSSKCYIEAVDVHSNHQALSLHGIHDQRTFTHNQISPTSNLYLRGPRGSGKLKKDFDHNHVGCVMPSENGPSTFYRHLCSEDDPPRSGMYTLMS